MAKEARFMGLPIELESSERCSTVTYVLHSVPKPSLKVT